MQTKTIEIEVYDTTPGTRTRLTGRIMAERLTTYYGPGGDRLRCWYIAKLVRTDDGRVWLNHPRTPAYPEEVSLDADDWFLASEFPRCCPGLQGMFADAQHSELNP